MACLFHTQGNGGMRRLIKSNGVSQNVGDRTKPRSQNLEPVLLICIISRIKSEFMNLQLSEGNRLKRHLSNCAEMGIIENYPENYEYLGNVAQSDSDSWKVSYLHSSIY